MAFDRKQDFSDRTDHVSAWGWWDERDLIIGGSGDDTLRPGEGNDEVHGGEGNDCIEDATYNINPLTMVPFVGFFLLDATTDSEGKSMEDMFATPGYRSNITDAHESGDDVFFGDAGNDVMAG